MKIKCANCCWYIPFNKYKQEKIDKTYVDTNRLGERMDYNGLCQYNPEAILKVKTDWCGQWRSGKRFNSYYNQFEPIVSCKWEKTDENT